MCVAVVLPALAVAACGTGSDRPSADETGSATPAVVVTSSARACTADVDSVPAGARVVRIHNSGDKVTELYILRADGTKVAERESIEPGASEDMTVELTEGAHTLQCLPGKNGTTVAGALTVTAAQAGGSARDGRLAAAVPAYRAYVAQQAGASLAQARALRAAIAAGDVAKARELYWTSRVGWESMEPVAEAFGDVDPKVDLREADLEAGQTWTGWHVIEKQLWTKGSTAGLTPVATQLVTDLSDLVARIHRAGITPTSMANGAKELLDEVATGKVTGEEEAFSHTDLVDFAANVAGAKQAWTLLKPVVVQRKLELATSLDQRFAAVEELLAKYRRGAGYVSYDTVTQAQRSELSRAVDGLAEPLSQLAAAVA
ncbi:iron uptake system protein EfeO [Oryzihumus leptocrescens]|uniref:iron uptake system protein EfeO n=1 Tax=Oryzihumus leptocrescens TaxID=297536 RepID=UPI001153DD24|nr:iron uptake system protein EfeO [Oryzihumus leptocrescens]